MGISAIYPFIKSIYHPTVLGRYPWEPGSPCGIVVHHAADRDLDRVLAEGVRTLVGYHLIVDRDGLVHQAAYLDKAVAHAGDAMWNGKSPNRHFLAICVLSWGRLTPTSAGGKYVSWSGAEVPCSDVVMRAGNLSDVISPWDACSGPQFATLIDVLRWCMVSGGISASNVAGHEECALPTGRKDDPGGALPWTMAALRMQLTHP